MDNAFCWHSDTNPVYFYGDSELFFSSYRLQAFQMNAPSVESLENEYLKRYI